MPFTNGEPEVLGLGAAVMGRVRGMDLGGSKVAHLVLMANVAAGGKSRKPAPIMAVVSIALIVDSAILGILAGMSAIAGFGWGVVKEQPGAVAFTFLFAFLLQALRYLANARGLEPKSPP